MPVPVLVYVLTGLAAVVVALTRVRLRRAAPGGGRSDIARAPVGVHTVVGTLALLLWLVFLVGGDALGEGGATVVGIVALVAWWVVALAGLAILTRWLPHRGRHAAPAAEDTWTDGPWLSFLAHLGLLGAVLVFTYAYLVSAV